MITHKREFDLAKPKIVSHIFAVQGEGNTRSLEAKLFENGAAWTPPSNASIAVAFKKPDGTRGVCDMLPNGGQAITATGNTVTAILAPQVLTCPGEVAAALIFVDQNGNKLMSFPFCILVQEDPSAGADVSNNYFYFTSFDAINDAIGDMSKLETDDKTSLVAAINAASRTGGNVSNEQIADAVEEYLKENPIAAGDVFYVTASTDSTEDAAETRCTADKTIAEIEEAAYADFLPVYLLFPYHHANGNTLYCRIPLTKAHGGSCEFAGVLQTDDGAEIITAYMEGDDYFHVFRRPVPTAEAVEENKSRIDTLSDDVQQHGDQIRRLEEDVAGGVSPVASVTQTDSGAVISITDKNGTTTATIANGKDGAAGAAGKNGSDGKDGKDGNGIAAAVLNADYTLTLTFDDDTSYTTPSIRGATGSAGKDGAAGATGAAGKDGTSVTVASVSESTADGGSNVVTFSDGKTVTIKNGSKGAAGKNGKDATVLLAGKKIVYDGDSICESRTGSTANNGGGYAKIIADMVGGTYVNNAVSGALLSSHATRHSVVDSLSALPADGDLYCFEGGYNDYWQDVPIGTCDSADYTGNVDTSTICGAMEKIFRYCLSVFVGRPVCFIITHKCQNTAHTANGIGKTYKDYHDAMVQVCEKYSIPYYDAFNKSGLNGWNEAQSNAYLTANTSGSGDGVHPNEQGYKRYYVPQLISLFNSMMPTGIVQDATGEEPEQEAVNQIPISIDTDGSVFNGKGWIESKRISSSGTIKDADGYNLTGFIPLTQSETLTIASGVWKTLASSGTYNCFGAYDSGFAFLGVYYYGTPGVYGNGDGSVTFKPADQSPLTNIAYARIGGDGVDATAVATKG